MLEFLFGKKKELPVADADPVPVDEQLEVMRHDLLSQSVELLHTQRDIAALRADLKQRQETIAKAVQELQERVRNIERKRN